MSTDPPREAASMSPSLTTFRSDLRSGRVFLGTLVSESGAVAETLAIAGWDWLFIDLEHAPLTVGDAQRLLQAIGERTPAVIRVADRSETSIKQALDTGCSGVIVPQGVCAIFVGRADSQAIFGVPRTHPSVGWLGGTAAR